MVLKTLSFVFRVILLAVTFIAAIAEFIALLSPVVRPDDFSIFAVLTMVEPFLIALNLLTAFLWIILWKSWAFLPIIILIFSIGRVDSYFSYRISRDYGELNSENQKPIKKQLKLMSYNVRSFGKNIDTLDSIIFTIRNFDPDILCLVEFSGIDSIDARFSSYLPKLKYHASDKGTKGSLNKEHGIVLFSKYPLVNTEKYEYGTHGIAVAADAVIFYGDTLQIVGLHLESTNYNSVSNERELEVYMADSTIDQKGVIGSVRNDTTRTILKSRAILVTRTLSQQAYIRSLQADTIRERFIDPAERPIVLGDFNDTPYSYSVRRILGDNLVDPFIAVPQNKYGFTYNFLHKLFRIDYILLDRGSFEILDYYSPDLGFSDHNPVMVTARRTY